MFSSAGRSKGINGENLCQARTDRFGLTHNQRVILRGLKAFIYYFICMARGNASILNHPRLMPNRPSFLSAMVMTEGERVSV
jgi:hypothetical protein